MVKGEAEFTLPKDPMFPFYKLTEYLGELELIEKEAVRIFTCKAVGKEVTCFSIKKDDFKKIFLTDDLNIGRAFLSNFRKRRKAIYNSLEQTKRLYESTARKLLHESKRKGKYLGKDVWRRIGVLVRSEKFRKRYGLKKRRNAAFNLDNLKKMIELMDKREAFLKTGKQFSDLVQLIDS